MNERTEPRLPQVGRGRDGEGHEGMPSQLGMNERTEPRLPQVGRGRDGEGHEGMPKEDAA